MLDKSFEQLSMSEKFTLQKLVKKQRRGDALSEPEQALFEKFGAEFAAAEKAATSRWPIIVALLVISGLAVLRQCQ